MSSRLSEPESASMTNLQKVSDSAKGIVKEVTDEDTKSNLLDIIGVVSEQAIGINIVDFKNMAMPDNPVADVGDMPHWPKWVTFFLYQAAFFGVFGYFIYQQYQQGRTSTFITLDKKSGVCKGEPHSKYCCEVPQSITGTFLADSQGRWDTQKNFSYIQNNYAITVAGLEYTNADWNKMMKNITAQLKTIGNKGNNRDFAWNLVAWSSFTAQNVDNGFLQFYATGQTGIVYDKQVLQVGFASAQSEKQECSLPISTAYNSESSTLTISTQLCEKGPCIDNPCPNITAPGGMGYDYTQTSSNTMTLKVSMEAVTTALAVNMGMIKLNHLVQVPGDNARATLLNNMVSAGHLNQTQADHTSSYFDNLYAPTEPVYCHSEKIPSKDLTHTWDSGRAFCFVRIGNLLAYPVTSSYGWSNTGTHYPSKCTSGSTSDNAAAKYYCNLMDVSVSLIYYPVDNLNPNMTDSYTYTPTKYPTNAPTPPPGSPTIKPSVKPTFRPTKVPSGAPTPPPGAPTHRPTYRVTGKPHTQGPSPRPGKPTKLPSRSPTAKPSVSFRPTTSEKPTRRPSVSPKPTYSFKPTLSEQPTVTPTLSMQPSAEPTLSSEPTTEPTVLPTIRPTIRPTVRPTRLPTAGPTVSSHAVHRSEYLAQKDLQAFSDAPSEQPSEMPSYDDDNGYIILVDDADNYYSESYYANGPYYVPNSGIAYSYSYPDRDPNYGLDALPDPGDTYADNLGTDDFVPLTPVVVDNGKIFAFAEYASKQFDIVNNTVADIFVSNIAFEATTDTLIGTGLEDMQGHYHSYANDFAKLCSSDVDMSISEGCAMLAFEFYGGQDRAISDYHFQPSSSPAFTNTIFQPAEMIKLQTNTPTSLIQTYYTCVLAPWPAFFAALGLAASNVMVLVPLMFAVYMILTMHWLNYFHGAKIPAKRKKEREEQAEQEAFAAELKVMLEQFKALREDVKGGAVAAPKLSEAIDKGDAIVAAEVVDNPEGEGLEMAGYREAPNKDFDNPMKMV